jgi:hypothetical protein
MPFSQINDSDTLPIIDTSQTANYRVALTDLRPFLQNNLGTLATQNASAINVTGGTIGGLTSFGSANLTGSVTLQNTVNKAQFIVALNPTSTGIELRRTDTAVNQVYMDFTASNPSADYDARMLLSADGTKFSFLGSSTLTSYEFTKSVSFTAGGTLAGTFAGNPTFSGTPIFADFKLNASTSSLNRLITFTTGGLNRWVLAKASGNEDLQINRYDDAGAIVSTPFVIRRVTGDVDIYEAANLRSGGMLSGTFSGSPTLSGIPVFSAGWTSAGLTLTSAGALQTTGVGHGSVSGSTRGTGAVDLQTNRGLATQVASGNYSVVLGANSTASNTVSVAIGNSCISSGTASTAMGVSCSASGNSSLSVGNTNAAAGANSAVLNVGNATISGANGAFVTGYQAVGRRSAEQVHASGQIAAAGDAQTSVLVLRGQTTNTTLTELLKSSALGDQQITLQNDSTLAFVITASARRTDVDNESAGFFIQGVIDRNGTAASTALVGSVLKTVLARDIATWDVVVDADTTNGTLRIRVQGEAAKTISWVARVELTEVIG